MTEVQDQEMLTENLWVLAKLNTSVCAINSVFVESILLLEEDITGLPSSNDTNIGIVSYRGGVLQVVDLRCLMGMPSQAQEMREFEQMLEQRKQDHIRWVNELKRCIAEDAPFTLATDPHKCAFGKWYDSYKPTNQSVAFHLRKIDEPHQKLHGTAIAAFACERHCESCGRELCVQTAMKQGVDTYMPQVVALLEEAKQVFRDAHRKMVMVLTDGVMACGILVDEVLSAEPLVSMTESKRMDGSTQPAMVTHIAGRKNDDTQILVLNTDRILVHHEDEA